MPQQQRRHTEQTKLEPRDGNRVLLVQKQQLAPSLFQQVQEWQCARTAKVGKTLKWRGTFRCRDRADGELVLLVAEGEECDVQVECQLCEGITSVYRGTVHDEGPLCEYLRRRSDAAGFPPQIAAHHRAHDIEVRHRRIRAQHAVQRVRAVDDAPWGALLTKPWTDGPGAFAPASHEWLEDQRRCFPPMMQGRF